jgi:hypothetical protein
MQVRQLVTGDEAAQINKTGSEANCAKRRALILK